MRYYQAPNFGATVFLTYPKKFEFCFDLNLGEIMASIYDINEDEFTSGNGIDFGKVGIKRLFLKESGKVKKVEELWIESILVEFEDPRDKGKGKDKKSERNRKILYL